MKLNKKHILLALLSVSSLYAAHDPKMQQPATDLNSPLPAGGLGRLNPFNRAEVRSATGQTAFDAVITGRKRAGVPTQTTPYQATTAPTAQTPAPAVFEPKPEQSTPPAQTAQTQAEAPAAPSLPTQTAPIPEQATPAPVAQPVASTTRSHSKNPHFDKLVKRAANAADNTARNAADAIYKTTQQVFTKSTQPKEALAQPEAQQTPTPNAQPENVTTQEVQPNTTTPEPTVMHEALQHTGAGWGLVPFVAGGLLAGWAYNTYLCTQTLPANTQHILIEVTNKESKRIALRIESANIANTAQAINNAITAYPEGNFFNNDDQQKVTVEVTAFTSEKRTGNRLLFGVNGTTLTLPKNDFGQALWETLLANRLQPRIYNGVNEIPGIAHKTLQEITITATTIAAENPRLDTAPLVATGTAFAALKALGTAGLITATTPWFVPTATAVFAAGIVYGARERTTENLWKYTYGSFSEWIQTKFGYRIPKFLHLERITQIFSITARTPEEAKALFAKNVKNRTAENIQVNITTKYTQHGRTESYKITPVTFAVTKESATDMFNQHVQPLLNP